MSRGEVKCAVAPEHEVDPTKDDLPTQLIKQDIAALCDAIDKKAIIDKTKKVQCGLQKYVTGRKKKKKTFRNICIWKPDQDVPKKKTIPAVEPLQYPPYGDELFKYLQAKFGKAYHVHYNDDGGDMIFVSDTTVTAKRKKITTYPLHVSFAQGAWNEDRENPEKSIHIIHITDRRQAAQKKKKESGNAIFVKKAKKGMKWYFNVETQKWLSYNGGPVQKLASYGAPPYDPYTEKDEPAKTPIDKKPTYLWTAVSGSLTPAKLAEYTDFLAETEYVDLYENVYDGLGHDYYDENMAPLLVPKMNNIDHNHQLIHERFEHLTGYDDHFNSGNNNYDAMYLGLPLVMNVLLFMGLVCLICCIGAAISGYLIAKFTAKRKWISQTQMNRDLSMV